MASILDTGQKSSVGCITSAVGVLGEKWTALILRELMDGSKRFCQLERSVGNVNPRTLSNRLNSLVNQGIISGDDCYYELTKKGEDLMPILQQMAAWSSKYPA